MRSCARKIVLLWQSNDLYRTAPTVDDEVRNLLARFRESIFDEATLLFERLRRALRRRSADLLVVRQLDRFGSRRQRERRARRLARRARARARVHPRAVRSAMVEELQARFSQDADRAATTPELLASIERDHAELPDVRYTIGPRQEAEPYRRKLAFIHRRLSLDAAPTRRAGMPSAAALSADVALIEAQRHAHSGDDVARPLRRLRCAIAMFGFQLYALRMAAAARQSRRNARRDRRAVETGEPLLSLRSDAEKRAWFEREFRACGRSSSRRHRYSAQARDIWPRSRRSRRCASGADRKRRVVDPGRGPRRPSTCSRCSRWRARAARSMRVRLQIRPAARERDRRSSTGRDLPKRC